MKLDFHDVLLLQVTVSLSVVDKAITRVEHLCQRTVFTEFGNNTNAAMH